MPNRHLSTLTSSVLVVMTIITVVLLTSAGGSTQQELVIAAKEESAVSNLADIAVSATLVPVESNPVSLRVASIAALDTVQVQAAVDGINTDALLHDSRSSLYRTPGGAAPFDTPVTLRLRAAAGDLDSASVRVWDTRTETQVILPMQVMNTTADGYDLWEAVVNPGRKTTVLWYRFILTGDGQTIYYEDDTRPDQVFVPAREGGAGTAYTESPDLSFQITVYDPEYYTPEWMRDAVVYQIFPDRFRNGDTSNDPASESELFYGELPLFFHDTWNEPMLDGRVDSLPNGNPYWNSDFYGGDLAGITEKLDYLQSLGVTAIYLNPIFEARSNHRYDTADYLQIDRSLGTMEEFEILVSEAESRGMKLILDGVFNHMSSDSRYFDRYNRFDEVGACESLESPYRTWFYFAPPRANQPSPCVGDPDPLYYVSWFGFDSIPRINNTLIETRRFIFLDENSVARFWGNAGIGGWRLDVAPDIDNGRDPNNIYWETFRNVVRQVNPETVVIGEDWHDSSEWLQGDEWDSTMNYRLRRAVLGFARDTDFVDNDANGDNTIRALSPSGIEGIIRAIEEDYPHMAYLALMNILDSHDTSRLFFVLENNPQQQKLAALTQFMLPGAPTVYYGDEIAIDAPSKLDSATLQDDPYNRAPYPWPDASGDFYPAPDEDMLAYYQQLGALRRDNPALRQGEHITLLTDDESGIYAFLRLDTAAGNAALVVLNNSDSDQTALVDYAGLLPTGITLQPTFGGDAISTDSLSINLTIPALSGNVWTFTGESRVFDLPAAPANVAAEGENGRVLISWDAVEDAAGYLVYRSAAPVGGFEPIEGVPVLDTSYDADAPNGFVYYYAVAAVSENSLIGELSTSAMAVASDTISAVAYLGESLQPRSVGLTFGVTVDLQAAVRVDGLTEADGQALSIRAQATFAPAGADLTTAAWIPMTYSGEDNGADVYTITFSPQEVGEFITAARFSTDAGLTWTDVVLEDGTFPAVALTASDDTTPPAAPASVALERASLSGVSLIWEAVVDDNLFGYRVYRISADGAATLVGETAVADETTYTDRTVLEGETYTYAVTAVDGSLNESAQTTSESVTVERLVVPMTFTVTVPDYTSSDVYIAGDFGADFPSWDPAGMVMTKVDDTHWTITLDLVEGTAIQYKYVRGDWVAVEKDADCQEISNRMATSTPDDEGLQLIEDTVAKWRDLDACG